MFNPSRLVIRPSGFYFRLTVPARLRPILGQREIVRALPCVNRQDAQHLANRLSAGLKKLFDSISRGAVLTQEITKIVAKWLDQELATDEHQRAQGGRRDSQDIEAAEAGLSGVLDDYVDALRENDFKIVRDDIAVLENAEGLKLDETERNTLARELIRANITLLRIQKARVEGDYDLEHSLLLQPRNAGTSTPVESGPKLSALANKYVEFKTQDKRWSEKSKQQNIATLNLLIDVVGDLDASEVTHETAEYFLTSLRRLPAHRNKKKEYRDKSVAELLAMNIKEPLDPETVKNLYVRVSSFFKWATRRGGPPINYFEGLVVSRKNRRDDEARDVWSLEDLRRLFSGPAHTHPNAEKPYTYWVPLIGLYSGCRLDEICQLHLEDLRTIDDVPVFDINDQGTKKLKNITSRRLVPIHPTLITAGLLKFATSLRKQGQDRLFPELPKKRDGYGQIASKWFARYKALLGLRIPKDQKKDFHSFRGTFAASLQHHDVLPETMSDLLGHVKEGETARYAKRHRPTKLLEAVQKVDFGTAAKPLKWG